MRDFAADTADLGCERLVKDGLSAKLASMIACSSSALLASDPLDKTTSSTSGASSGAQFRSGAVETPPLIQPLSTYIILSNSPKCSYVKLGITSTASFSSWHQ
jgi:hypothetical protein